jgi:hypothetical protein
MLSKGLGLLATEIKYGRKKLRIRMRKKNDKQREKKQYIEEKSEIDEKRGRGHILC